ncbi:MAG: class I SAM-dependent methyltransferase [Rhodothermales bacterium]
MRITNIVHTMVREVIRPGDRVVDATCGNGHDSEFLAAKVGPEGHVWSLDVQDAAVQATRMRLSTAGLAVQSTVVQADHASLATVVPAAWKGTVSAVLFNLGYLPGADRGIRTRPGSTIAALGDALDLLRQDGMVSVVVYPGHEGGADESHAVRGYVSALDPKQFGVWRYESMNGPPTVPWLAIIRRSRHHP